MLALLIAGISTGAAFAYLTAQESVENRITASDTDIEITEKYEMTLKTYENIYFYPIITEKDVLKYILRQSTTGRILENPKN